MTARELAAAPLPIDALSARPDSFTFPDLRIFNRVPANNHDVVTLAGMVMVYRKDVPSSDGIRDSALYVVECQRPVSGLSWEAYDRFNSHHGPREPRVRIITCRKVVKLVKREGQPDMWWHIDAAGRHDGPFADWSVAHDLIGVVVGIYQPGGHSPA